MSKKPKLPLLNTPTTPPHGVLNILPTSPREPAVPDSLLTWLHIERRLEKEWNTLQEKSFSQMLKRQQLHGRGAKESDRATVGPCKCYLSP